MYVKKRKLYLWSAIFGLDILMCVKKYLVPMLHLKTFYPRLDFLGADILLCVKKSTYVALGIIPMVEHFTIGDLGVCEGK